MPKDLVDVSQWETVAVPVGTDPATAASVETPCQLLTDRSRYLLDYALRLRLVNWTETDSAGLAAMDGGPGEGLYDPVSGHHTTIHDDGANTEQPIADVGGWHWTLSGAPPTGRRYTIDHDGAGSMAADGAAGGPAYCDVAGGGWLVPVAWIAAGQHGIIRHDRAGLWLVGKNITTSNLVEILRSTGPLVAFAAPATPPGFIGGGTLYCLEHSHDAGNPLWVALTGNQCSTSVDGNTWKEAAAHGLSKAPLSLAYSQFGATWIAALKDGSIATSTDGVTWTKSTPFITGLAGALNAHIATGGLGDWVIVLANAGGLEIWVSADNGVTWTEAWLPYYAPPHDHVALWYGQGRFNMLLDDGSGDVVTFFTLRADD